MSGEVSRRTPIDLPCPICGINLNFRINLVSGNKLLSWVAKHHDALVWLDQSVVITSDNKHLFGTYDSYLGSIEQIPLIDYEMISVAVESGLVDGMGDYPGDCLPYPRDSIAALDCELSNKQHVTIMTKKDNYGIGFHQKCYTLLCDHLDRTQLDYDWLIKEGFTNTTEQYRAPFGEYAYQRHHTTGQYVFDWEGVHADERCLDKLFDDYYIINNIRLMFPSPVNIPTTSIDSNKERKQAERELLLKYHQQTIKGLIYWYLYLVDTWLEDSWVERPSIEYDMAMAGVVDWLEQPYHFEERKAKVELQPGYFGDPNPGIYRKELIDNDNRRLLYTSTSNRGATHTYNVLLSAPKKDTLYLTLLMNHLFLCPLDQVVGSKENPAHLSIHPFVSDPSDQHSIGILFTYKVPNLSLYN